MYILLKVYRTVWLNLIQVFCKSLWNKSMSVEYVQSYQQLAVFMASGLSIHEITRRKRNEGREGGGERGREETRVTCNPLRNRRLVISTPPSRFLLSHLVISKTYFSLFSSQVGLHFTDGCTHRNIAAMQLMAFQSPLKDLADEVDGNDHSYKLDKWNSHNYYYC